jgi:DNA-binding NtrC family response regulator
MNILVIDDEINIGKVIQIIFEKTNNKVEIVQTGEDGLKKIKENLYDIIICDMKLPDISGLDILKKIKKEVFSPPFIMITAYASTKTAVEAMKNGAEDYIIKPFDIDELRIIVQKVYEKRKMEIEYHRLKQEIETKYSFENIISKNKKMKDIFVLIEKVASLDSTILITGESGTGKDLLAKAIHYRSNRKDKPFVSINCASIPESLLESELFGYRRGAFTGAVSNKNGLFQEAKGGTLFLDEIAEMPLSLQAKLLRVIQDKKVRALGETKEEQIDVRIITATNHNLLKEVEDGRFREDLYYRINVINIEVPSLRERRNDIPVLSKHFLDIYNEKTGKNITEIDSELLELFYNYNWPGNVRELENIIERLVILEDSNRLTINNLPKNFIKKTSTFNHDEELDFNNFDFSKYLDDITKTIINKALQKTKWNKKKAAELLGISYRSFRYYFNKYNS